MKDKIYKSLPHFLQNSLISLYNYRAYKIRYGGQYKSFREERKRNRNLSRSELESYQRTRYKNFINFVIEHSPYYKETIGSIIDVTNIKNINKLPITNKETLRTNIDSITSEINENLEISKTGGTTGKSLSVKYRAKNTQERFAFLDDFRSRFGYELGKKTAWFSGKNLLTQGDIKKNRFWKTDYYHKVRYYSTFHINQKYLKYYVEDLINFQPKYFVGFPSTILEIAKYGIANNYEYPKGVTKAIFPTAETITSEMREKIELFFHAKLYDQYASSEGAPFIFECVNGNLHLELQSGVFEVLDDNSEPAQSGRLVVTSFTTEATPLIRYDIGDSIILEDETKICNCGNNNPLVKKILGRIDDYVYSPETGKINLGNVSNTLKDTEGILKFQAVQNQLNSIEIYLIVDKQLFNKNIEHKFIQNWRDRLGNNMELKLLIVDHIKNEKSGKFRIVKNNIKHLIP